MIGSDLGEIPNALLDGVASVGELRRRLIEDCKTGRAAWIQLHGLSVDQPNVHGALLHALTAFRLGGDHGRVAPRIAVLDWTNVDGTTAEALSMFAILVRTLVARGVAVVVCGPADGDIANALEASGIRATCGDVKWIFCDCRRRGRAEVLVPSSHFAGTLGRAALGPFLAATVTTLEGLQIRADHIALFADALMEILVNVVTHAGAEQATASLILHCRRRPRVIEVGLADSGMGIATNMLMQPRHAWLATMSDRAATEAVFGQALSGRDAADGGGGMTRIMKRIVNACNSTLIVRSGAAKLTLTGPLQGGASLVGHTFGWGTQTRLTLPVEPNIDS